MSEDFEIKHKAKNNYDYSDKEMLLLTEAADNGDVDAQRQRINAHASMVALGILTFFGCILFISLITGEIAALVDLFLDPSSYIL